MVNPTPPSSITLKSWMEAPLPDPVSLWPQTIGWQVLLVVILLGFIRLVIWRIELYRFYRYQREAQHALNQDSGMSATQSAHYYFQVMKAIAQYVDASSAPYYRVNFTKFLANSFSLPPAN
ncbi:MULTISPECIES: DUF4381 domain-containing protein [Vibrio]|uniref:DUF4381 domain-containing protein n=1 Tax=Vibrio TaxID=662 RepID=UPI000B5C1D5F|nr:MULTISPECIES: DUF4381 domain-containing protein [Vibrio]HBV76060.1 DUF4381 domain-containing protein [Vibrio sp.]